LQLAIAGAGRDHRVARGRTHQRWSRREWRGSWRYGARCHRGGTRPRPRDPGGWRRRAWGTRGHVGDGAPASIT